MWIYIKTFDDTNSFYTVGFYTPDGEFIGDEDFLTKGKARLRVHYLNGGEV